MHELRLAVGCTHCMPKVDGGAPAGHHLDQLSMSDMDNIQTSNTTITWLPLKLVVVIIRCAIPYFFYVPYHYCQSTNMTMLENMV